MGLYCNIMHRGEHISAHLADMMRLRDDLSHQQLQRVPLSLQEYDYLLVDLLSVRLILTRLVASLYGLIVWNQCCDEWGYTKNTKFLAKTLFDLALTRLPHISIDNAPLYLLSALRTAVKFNENDCVSRLFTVGVAAEVHDGKFQQDQFVQAELQLLRTVGFRLALASPYDYLQLTRPVLQGLTNVRSGDRRLEILIDFALSLPELTLCPAQHLFLACFHLIFPDQGQLFDIDGMARTQEVEPLSRLIGERFQGVVTSRSTRDFNAV